MSDSMENGCKLEGLEDGFYNDSLPGDCEDDWVGIGRIELLPGELELIKQRRKAKMLRAEERKRIEERKKKINRVCKILFIMLAAISLMLILLLTFI